MDFWACTILKKIHSLLMGPEDKRFNNTVVYDTKMHQLVCRRLENQDLNLRLDQNTVDHLVILDHKVLRNETPKTSHLQDLEEHFPHQKSLFHSWFLIPQTVNLGH